MKYSYAFISVLALCFAAQSVAFYSTGGRTLKGESNYFSSIARIQSGAKGDTNVLLLGSSLTGRLPDRAPGFVRVANLGSDGGSAVDTLRAIDQGIIPSAPLIIVEGNTLYRAAVGRESDVELAIRSLWFRVGVEVSSLSAAARPASLVYSRLLGVNQVDGASLGQIVLLPMDASPSVRGEKSDLPVTALALIEEVNEIFVRLRERGSEIMLVILPPGAKRDTLNYRIPAALSHRSGVPLLDLSEAYPAHALRYTDGLHMSQDSAAAVLLSILSVVPQSNVVYRE